MKVVTTSPGRPYRGSVQHCQQVAFVLCRGLNPNETGPSGNVLSENIYVVIAAVE